LINLPSRTRRQAIPITPTTKVRDIRSGTGVQRQKLNENSRARTRGANMRTGAKAP
jgi:hypothetical protein